jgi:uncharacterized protein YbjT (DUF2867 family)
MKRVLVAGATGYLDGHVVSELKQRGYFVRALARRPERLASLGHGPDEVVRAEVTRPETLGHVCDEIDVVFSSVGITRQKDGLTFRDVDYQGNKNLLDAAQRAGVSKFVYVSVLDGPNLRQLDIGRAHEEFVGELERSGIDYSVLRPTGYFSDMGEIYDMASKGRVYLIGDGCRRTNPIHGADLAVRCADAVEDGDREIPVGGPETMTWREIAQLALRAQHRPDKITCIPAWVMWLAIFVTRLFSHHSAELMAFFATLATRDVVGPAAGTRTLEAHYASLGEKP